ncbi:MAG: cytidylate kinase-like family protein [Dehalococcoidales bacterium]|nr:cytidylate kinase-like family protein [Dehalococcoidales bacterium]
MSVITIRGQMGSGAPDIGQLIASKLGYDYVDRQILAKVAEHTRYSEEGIEKKEMPPGTLFGRIVEAFNSSYLAADSREGAYVPVWDFPLDDRRYLDSLHKIIFELAARGSIVIRGRGSHLILKGYPDVMHIFTVAPLRTRVKRVMDSLAADEETARNKIHNFDSSRREFIKRYFKSTMEDPLNYDLVINTGKIGYEYAALMAISALTKKQHLPGVTKIN